MPKIRSFSPWIIPLIAALFFVPGLGAVHLFDWDEVNFAEISREMIITKDYLRIYVNFLPFWEKPPLFFWLQSACMRLFGVGEFAARLPNALCGILTLPLLYHLGKQLFHCRMGWLWAGAYFGSILPHLYFRSGIIDPWFNLFIFVGLYFVILFHWKKNAYETIKLDHPSWLYLFLGGLIVGLGILTKGPVAYLVVCLCLGIYWIFQRFRFYINPLQFLFFTLATTIVTLTWYGLETWWRGPWFITEFNKYQIRLFSTPDAGHAGFPAYHAVVLLFGCFPASVFAIRAFFRSPRSESTQHQRDFKLWMSILFWVVLILFSIVKSKIVHYSSLCYFPLTFLAAYTIDQIWEKKIEFNSWMKVGFWLTGLPYVLAVTIAPILGRNIDWLKPLFSKDPFALANLEANVLWTGLEIMPGILLLVVMMFFISRIRKFDYRNGFLALFVGVALFISFTLYFFINKVEGYSQNAVVEFMEKRVGEDCYVATFGYKSYVQLFYTKKQPGQRKESNDLFWLLTGEVDKPTYVVTKIHKAKEIAKYEKMIELYRKNGFVFFKREEF